MAELSEGHTPSRLRVKPNGCKRLIAGDFLQHTAGYERSRSALREVDNTHAQVLAFQMKGACERERIAQLRMLTDPVACESSASKLDVCDRHGTRRIPDGHLHNRDHARKHFLKSCCWITLTCDSRKYRDLVCEARIQRELCRGAEQDSFHYTASRGDLILTPNGTWHDHGNDSSEPVIWIDMLDWPLMEFLDAAWVDHDMPGAQGNAKVQAVTKGEGRSRRLYGHGGIKPAFVDHQIGVGRSPAPLIHYRGADVLETLHSLRKEEGDPHEGIKVDFVNPVTGEPVFKTLNYSAQLLRPGEETELKRETAGTFYVVIEGSGATEVGGKRFEWTQNDIFVVPNFLWRRHINTGKADAVLYAVSDEALMRNIGQYYAQGRAKDGKITELAQ